MPAREDILTGAKAAARLHEKFDTRQRVEKARGAIDVFGSVGPLEGTLIFRPLKGLLGAYLPGPAPGIMVTTERSLPIQRFTGAHELGHLFLKHEQSLDGEEILKPLAQTNPVEVQANAFAAEFLMPRWMLSLQARRQNWNRDDMGNPIVVYQMALRLGTSYEATCRALTDHKIIDISTAQKLTAIQPRKIKQTILPKHQPKDWFFDVWMLTSADEGALIEGQPKDVFLLKLTEKPAASYLWNIEELQAKGFVVLRDSRSALGNDEVGSPAERQITACTDCPSRGELSVPLKRPWLKSAPPAAEFRFNYDLLGKEAGLPRAQRRVLEATL